jgi:hypothetical protein
VVEGAEVAAYRYDDGEWTYGKSTFTASDGRFNLGGLSDGQWTLEFNPPTEGPDADLALQYWEESRVFDEDDTFGVRPGITVEDKEAHLAPGGRISGKVTGPDGEPVVDALVFGYPSTSEAEVGNVAFTDENGNYEMTGLSAGEHRLEFVDALEFDPFGDGPKYLPEWWDDRESFAVAERVTVTAGQTSGGKNAQLDLVGTSLENTEQPSISGEARVGSPLTANPGTWTPRISDATFQYQWYADDAAISGADEKAFIPNANQLDKRISVSVTAERNADELTARSQPTDPVAKGVLVPITPLSLAPANPRVGDKLDVDNATFKDWSSSSIQYLADGEPFVYDSREGVPASVLGKRLSVRQVTTSHGYETFTTTSDESPPVQMGEFDPVTTARIYGVPIVGESLETARVNDVYGADYRYQWLADGVEIPGADQPTYTPTTEEIGKALSVRLAMSKTSYNPAESTGESTEPVHASGELAVTPSEVEVVVSPSGEPPVGAPRVGHHLSARTWTWQPDHVTFSYEWLADGVPIAGATDAGYTVTSNEAGKKIAVEVTGSKSGYASASATSAPTQAVMSSTPFGAPRDFKVTGSTVTTLGLSWTKVDGAAKYRIYYGIGNGTRTKIEVGNVTTAKLTNLKPNTYYSIDIAALRADGTRSPYSPRIPGETEYLYPPSGLAVSQRTSTSLTLTWTKVPGVPKYRIWHGIGSGTRTKLEVGNVSTATITGLKPGTTYSIDIASLLSDGTTRSAYTPRINGTTAD